jgi:hypothetical protein
VSGLRGHKLPRGNFSKVAPHETVKPSQTSLSCHRIRRCYLFQRKYCCCKRSVTQRREGGSSGGSGVREGSSAMVSRCGSFLLSKERRKAREDGRARIHCRWTLQATSSGESQAARMAAACATEGAGLQQQERSEAHFRQAHASCGGRDAGRARDAVSIRAVARAGGTMENPWVISRRQSISCRQRFRDTRVVRSH